MYSSIELRFKEAAGGKHKILLLGFDAANSHKNFRLVSRKLQRFKKFLTYKSETIAVL